MWPKNLLRRDTVAEEVRRREAGGPRLERDRERERPVGGLRRGGKGGRATVGGECEGTLGDVASGVRDGVEVLSEGDEGCTDGDQRDHLGRTVISARWLRWDAGPGASGGYGTMRVLGSTGVAVARTRLGSAARASARCASPAVSPATR